MADYTAHMLTGYQADELISWFDQEIGTENEIDDHGDGQFSVTFFEMTTEEKRKLKRQEAKILNQHNGGSL